MLSLWPIADKNAGAIHSRTAPPFTNLDGRLYVRSWRKVAGSSTIPTRQEWGAFRTLGRRRRPDRDAAAETLDANRTSDPLSIYNDIYIAIAMSYTFHVAL